MSRGSALHAFFTRGVRESLRRIAELHTGDTDALPINGTDVPWSVWRSVGLSVILCVVAPICEPCKNDWTDRKPFGVWVHAVGARSPRREETLLRRCTVTFPAVNNLKVTHEGAARGNVATVATYLFTSRSFCKRTRATRCVTPLVLYTKADTQCDKLATVIDQSWQHMRRSTVEIS